MAQRLKYIFITGGVISSLGKGITAASIGMLLTRMGVKVKLQKLDPYINVDPGTMNPFEHGECYVTDDGAETDLDLGHYERFTGIPVRRASNYTTGQIYSEVIRKERMGEFLGKTVQVIPHITDEIKRSILSIADQDTEVIISEIGGTVGDIEGLPMLEAIRQIRHEVGSRNAMFLHLTLVPYIRAAGELKTKPTQQSVGELRRIGIQPDVLIIRCEKPLEEELRKKIALFCNVDHDNVIEERDVDTSIYEVPMVLYAQGLDRLIAEHLSLPVGRPKIGDWIEMIEAIKEPKWEVTVGVVGKYGLQDAYKSIYEALSHASAHHKTRVNIRRIDAEKIEKQGAETHLRDVDALLVPGGFGSRGIEGKIAAIRYARERKLPFFGICLGMQCAVIEFGRNVCAMKQANSAEFDETPSCEPVIHLMPDQQGVVAKGGTMRLGAYPCQLRTDSKSFAAYGAELVSERHRHRYEFNNANRERYEHKGMQVMGQSPDGKLVEIVEIPDHPWFVGVQFHPEFKSQPTLPQPLFRDFIGAALARVRASQKGSSARARSSRRKSATNEKP